MSSIFSRRDFLERTAIAAAAMALPLPAAGAQASMFISLNGAVSPRVGAWPEKARLAARVGYGGVDWDFAPAKTAGVDATKALFAELKIRPTIVNLPLQQPFAGDDQAFKDKLPQLAEDAAFVSAVGGERMMLVLSATSALPKEEQRKLVRDRLAAISEVLQKSKIRLGLEFLGPQYMRMPAPPPAPGAAPGGAAPGGAPAAAAPPAAATPAAPAPGSPAAAAGPGTPGGGRGQGGGGARGPRIPFIWTLPETVQLGKDSGPNIGAILDIWHWYHSGGTVKDILATDPARIIHVHISDAKPMPPEDVRDNMRLMPGEGSIDVTGFLQALQKIGYVGGVAPEPLGRIPAEMTTEDAAKLGYETTLAAMKKAGVI